RRKFEHLAIELAWANTHFLFYKRLSRVRKGEYQKEFCKSIDFWEHTISAHGKAALIGLCRVYDDHRDEQKRPERDPFHLLRFVEEVETIAPKSLNEMEKKSRTDDLQFLQKEKPKENKFPCQSVAKLRKWRNNVLAHSNRVLVQGGRDEFLKEYEFDEQGNEIQYL